MKLLDETDALYEIRKLLTGAAIAKLAVAFWGKGAIERLDLDKAGLQADILCNLDSGACNPAELHRIRALPGISLRSHPSLHAKVYWTPSGAVLGSSNASANGLALENDAAGAWSEANVLLEEAAVLADIETWFKTLFDAGHEVLDDDLDRAEMIWKARTRMAPTGKRLVGKLLTAFANAPSHPAWKQVKLAFWKDGLGEITEWLEAEQAAGRLGADISAYDDWNEHIRPNDWVLDFDVSGQVPRFGGAWRALATNAGRPTLRLVVKVGQLRFPAFGELTFDSVDAAPLLAIAQNVLVAHSEDGGRNAVIDLPTAMAILPTASALPSEKAFTKAMEQIYIDAVAIGYRPTIFRRMLADLGGVETARRLIVSDATSGFTKLWEKKRLDLSIEALILKSEWLPLFSAMEHQIARKRLSAYGYFPKP